MTTNVPAIVFGPNGFETPTEQAILVGVQADINAAFGGNLDPGLSTPQGQLAMALTQILGANNNLQLALFNGVDPAKASGELQDAIARIYFLTRKPAQSTSVICTCIGLQGTVIPKFTQAKAEDGNVYESTVAGTIPVGGSLAIPFACQTAGPIACPAGTVNQIYRAIPGWDSITNPSDGVIGVDEEGRFSFERRRQQSVSKNSINTLASIRGAVLELPNVLDVFSAENVSDDPVPITIEDSFTADIAGTTMTVSAITLGQITVGMQISGPNLARDSIVGALGTGTGGAGTYIISPSQTVASQVMYGGMAIGPH